MEKEKDFEILYNALSVGWHLRKIMEVAPEIVADKKSYERFIGWLERHNIKPHGGTNHTRQS